MRPYTVLPYQITTAVQVVRRSFNSDLATHLKQSLPSFAVPLFLRITKELRLTGNMKHQKHELKEEGVDPSKVDGECVYWLRDGGYKQFTLEDWEGINRGFIRL